MKKGKKLVFTFVAALPTLFSLSCSGQSAQQIRDAFLNGTSSFIEQQTLDILDMVFPSPSTPS